MPCPNTADAGWDDIRVPPCACRAQFAKGALASGSARDGAVKLVDDLAGESPVSADYPVGAVVISGDGTGDQAVGSPDVNALEGWT